MIGPSNTDDDTIKGPMTLVDMPHRKSPEEIAAAHKKSISEALGPVMAAMDAAKADGFRTAWTIGDDYAGHHCITRLMLVKEF
jgi:hypothetical protein